ncbi:MAG: hypothetical protein Q7T20_03070, partial [Saprospiraceae bacterium]|nr:hypothetical protein [Saprospiraceae bacterium]
SADSNLIQINIGSLNFGTIFPGQILEGTVSINLKDRSRFSPNIALDFDPAQAVDECGRTGNVWVVQLRY